MQEKKSHAYSLRFLALLCFLIVLALLLLLRLFKTEQFISWYGKYTQSLVNFEMWLENYGATPMAVIIIVFNYALKAFIPWFPVSCICVASAVLFKWYYALAINLAGLTLLFTLKYFWGKIYGGGNAEKILSKYSRVQKMLDESRLGSGAVLFFTRLLPSIPINSVSCVYGTTEMPLWKYLLISNLGFLYKLVSYIIIGRNVFDPASASFVVPFIPLILLSGMIFLSLGSVMDTNSKKSKIINKDKERLM